ncbi:MAG: hypothetical protein M3349_06345 [Actinomycetota bacterium]|nr:hypothetical protein [Actinomycetota bacterium]
MPDPPGQPDPEPEDDEADPEDEDADPETPPAPLRVDADPDPGPAPEADPDSEEPPSGDADDGGETPEQTVKRRIRELTPGDPDRGGKVGRGSEREAEVAATMEQRRLLTPPVSRPKDAGQGDFEDGDGQRVEIKGPKSREAVAELMIKREQAKGKPVKPLDPDKKLGGQFELDATMESVDEARGKGKRVVLDTAGLNTADEAALRDGVTDAGYSDEEVTFFDD